MAGLEAPRATKVQVDTESVATGATGVHAVRAPMDGKLASVTYVPEAAITGADTNSRTITLVNKGQDGTGNVNMATLALTNGVNAAAYDEKTIPLNATPANLTVVAGDVIQINSTFVGTGIADPGGVYVLSFTN